MTEHVNLLNHWMIAAAQQQQEPPPFWMNMVPMFLLIVIFYFLLIRPQQKKAKDHAQMLTTIKSGDKILTSGGLIGVVIAVKEKTVSLRSAESKLELSKSAVAEIVERSSKE